MKHPFLCLAVLYAAGTGLSHQVSETQFEWGVAGLSLSLALYVLSRLWARSRFCGQNCLTQICVLLTFCSAGLFADASYHIISSTNVSRWTTSRVQVPLRVIGRASRFSFSDYSESEFSLEATHVIYSRDTLVVSGRIQVRTRSDSSGAILQAAHAGDVFDVTGYLLELPVLRNPFDFDQGAFLRSRGFSAMLRAQDLGIVLVEHVHSGPVYKLEQLRDRIEERITDSHPSAFSSQLLPALLIGRKTRIDSSIKSQFRRSGLAHLLAISGLHVGIIGVSLYWILGLWLTRARIPFRSRQWMRGILVSLFLACYAVLSGGSPSVVRAVLMAVVLIFGKCSGRKVEGFNALGVAVLIILIIYPDDLFGPGFQLSVSALTGIFFYLNSSLPSIGKKVCLCINPGFRPLCNRIIQSFGMTTFILAFTSPFLLYHFGESQLGGLVSNIVAIPVTGLLLYCGILSTAFGPDAVMPLALFTEATDLLSSFLVYIAHRMSLLAEPAVISASGVHRAFLWLLPLAASLLLVSHSRINFRKTSALAILTILFGQMAFLYFEKDEFITASFFDVGQGDATLIVTPKGKSLLIDTGPGYLSADTIRRHLRGAGVSELDALVITHPHRDHAGGLKYILKTTRVHHIFAHRVEPIVNVIDQMSGKHDISVSPIVTGYSIPLDPSVRIQVLAPPTGSAHQVSVNRESIVLRLTYGKISMLMMGDAERSTEHYMVRYFNPMLNAQIIKIGHHGSTTSSSPPLVRRLTGTEETLAVVSVGKSNSFNHPDPEVLKRWGSRNTKLLLTSISGATIIRSDGQNIIPEFP